MALLVNCILHLNKNSVKPLASTAIQYFFATLTEQQLRRGTHRSVPALEKAIREYLKIYNEQPKPFHWTKSADEIKEISKKLIGMKMVNNQTGPQGVIANQVMISLPVDIEKEYYIGAVIDREHARPILIASPEGGMEIEYRITNI